jgi:hypothetical protein
MEAVSVVEAPLDHRAVTTAEVVVVNSTSVVVVAAEAVCGQKAECEARAWLSRNNTTAMEESFCIIVSHSPAHRQTTQD